MVYSCGLCPQTLDVKYARFTVAGSYRRHGNSSSERLLPHRCVAAVCTVPWTWAHSHCVLLSVYTCPCPSPCRYVSVSMCDRGGAGS
jgi:hypothetical protein